MSPIWGLAVAGLGVLTGLSWRFDWGWSRDLACFRKINRMQVWDSVDRFVIFTQPLGANWILLIILAIVSLWQLQMSGYLAVAAIFTAAMERGIKLVVKRPRPFLELEEVRVRQKPTPKDPGFPSGDATRVWFLFAAILFGIHPAPAWSMLAGFCAVVVSFGRVRLGVHYPLDVWAGAGLGFGLGMAWSGFIL